MRIRYSKIYLASTLALVMTIGGVFSAWNYAIGKISDENVDVGIGFKDWTQPTDIYITKADIIDSNNAVLTSSSINSFTSTKLNSKIVLNSSSDSYVTLKVTFYNNTDTAKMYSSVQYTGDDLSYSNSDIRHDVSGYGLGVASPYSYFTINIKFSFDTTTYTNTTLNSYIKFLFNDFQDEAIVNVIEGASSDNIESLGDGNLTYSADTNYRWTNWVSSGLGVGEPAVLTFIWGEEVEMDLIRLFHFVDANASNPCEFPESMKISFYNKETGIYEEFTDYTTYLNYKNATRIDGVYNMDLVTTEGHYDINEDGVTIENKTFAYGYDEITPATTFSFNSKQKVQAIQITLDPPTTNFVGLVELQIFNGTDAVIFQTKTTT